MDGGKHVACISLEELFVHDGKALNAFGGRDGDTVKVTLADYLARRLRTLIMTRVRGNVAIEVMSVGRSCCCCGGGRGIGQGQFWRQRIGSDDAVRP